MNFLQTRTTSSSSTPNTLLSSLSSYTFNLCSCHYIFSPDSHYFLLLRSKYSPQQFALIHIQSVFLPLCTKHNLTRKNAKFHFQFFNHSAARQQILTHTQNSNTHYAYFICLYFIYALSMYFLLFFTTYQNFNTSVMYILAIFINTQANIF
jgi:hypothetical protein